MDYAKSSNLHRSWNCYLRDGRGLLRQVPCCIKRTVWTYKNIISKLYFATI